MGLILPNKFMQAGYGEGLRTLIAEAKAVWKIVDFGDAQIFSEATTYTCLLFLQKQPNTEALYVPAASWLKTQAITPQVMPDDLPEHQIQAATLASEAWHFAVGASAPLLERLRTMPVKLEDVTSRIFQGIKTSADKIYIVEEIQRKAGQVLVRSEAKGKQYWLERDLLHPLIKGGDSKRYHLSRTKRLILFPYAKQGNGVADLIPASTLRNDYPLVWAYLKDNKSYLENRESGKMRGPRWYGYVYPKALDVMPLSKIFTPDIAPGASFSVDDTGEVFFTGGVAECVKGFWTQMVGV